MLLTFIDTGVLITAARGDTEAALRAMSILDDPDRRFASSTFVKLEALPLPTYHKRDDEVAFLNAFFDQVSHWPESNEQVIEQAFAEASEAGIAALDALHVAAAVLIGADVLVTTEKRKKPLHRVKSIKVETL